MMRFNLKKAFIAAAAAAMTVTAAGAVGISASAADNDSLDVSKATSQQILEDMGIGWNLGNTLDAVGGSGLNTETSWGNPKTTQQLIDAVKEAGFNTVRVPVS